MKEYLDTKFSFSLLVFYSVKYPPCRSNNYRGDLQVLIKAQLAAVQSILQLIVMVFGVA